MRPSLEDNIPDIVLIHVGTNNITKKNQTEVEIFNEIMEVVKTCKYGGVNDIYIYIHTYINTSDKYGHTKRRYN